MDSIRLGYDTKVYHMEQGEPCGDSPPPPPLPLQPPPSLAEVNSNHNVDIDDDDKPTDETAWVGHQSDKMAECQGCIAEQRIEHTCTHAQPGGRNNHHHHHHHHHQQHEDQFVDVQRPSDNVGEVRSQPEPEPEPGPECEPKPEPEGEQEQKPRLGRNTWPRKKIRQKAHVASIFDADDDNGDDASAIAVESGSNYFVSVDDSVCDRGRLTEEYNLSRAGSVQRILRNSKQPLPPELETVKKGTPLYGQPSWWGDDTENNEMEAQGSSATTNDHSKPPPSSSRPCSLGVDPNASHPPPNPAAHTPPHRDSHKAVYMEIPHQPGTPERDKPSRDKNTPARSVTSSLSKDSLVTTPDSRERSMDKDLAADSGGGAGGNPALSFTVDFGDEKKPKLKSGASLSEFVPSKIRNSLSRSEKTASVSSTPAKGKDAAGSRKNSEERDLSPTRQKRLDELWSSEMLSKGKSPRRSSGQGTGVPSLRTADFASESLATDRSKEGKKEGEKRLREAERELDKKPPKSPKSQDTRKVSPRTGPSSAKAHRTKPQASAAAIAASVHAVQYSDSTAFLLDRMFAGTTGQSQDSPRSDGSEHDRGDSPSAPEHAMYKEAREYDRACQRGGLTYRAEKPPALKPKSLSKSPVASKPPPGSSSNSAAKPPTPASRKSPGVTVVAPKSPRAGGSKAVGKSPEKSSPRTPPQPLPQAPSPVADQEDKVSEAGTYTIEAEEDGAEEMLARQQIDEVFGVDVDSFPFERPIIGSQDCLVPGGEEEEEAERTLHEDDDDMDTGARTPCDEDDGNIFDDEEDGDEKAMTTMSGVCGEEDVPSWINQLQALTAATRAEKDDSPLLNSKDESSKKGTQGGLSRKRPGTGRKLPSIPGLNDQSPVSSEHSGRFYDNSPSSPATTLNGSLPGRLENGLDRTSADSPSRTVNFSSVVSSGVAASCRSALRDSPCDSEDLSRVSNNESATPKASSTCSRGSIDTELLLRDTETVMAAMEKRMGFRSQKKEGDGGDSDTDVSSTVAMVNGDDDFIKPTKYHSPRESMTRKSSKDKDNSNIRTASNSTASKRPLVRSFSEQKPGLKSDRSSRSGAGVSVVSDVLSRDDSLDQSFQSDFSDACSDRTDGSFTRTGSQGKGTITKAKPNRAFALRRARADGSEPTESARGRSNVSSPASSRRSSSIHGTSRTPHSDRTGTNTGRSEASLGAQIARKARENSHPPRPSRESSITRSEGPRRNSLRGSLASSTASSTISSAKKERDIRTLKSQLKTAPPNKDLAITGISSRSQSQPGSRSNSPKAAERMAWKRRKEYDPRKAVAEAKAKTKEPRPKPKVQHPSLYKNRMTRSASFTNSVELSGRTRHDTYNVESPPEDLSSAADANESYSEAGFRRAFIPFHNPLRGDRLSHSADEDEAGTFPPSQDFVGSSKPPSHPVSLKLHKSAFTPPLSKLQTPSPDSPPPPSSSFLLRRRTLGGMEYDESGASTASSSYRTQADSHRTQPTSPQSYDSLIVSSIYQLSLKLKTTMDKTLNKLREQDRVSITPSPIDDFLGHPTKSEIPAWKSANQELAGVLKNLRKMEHHLHLMERALFPDDDTDTDVSGMSSTEKLKYFQEIERIRGELAGFQPIDTPKTDQSQDPGSPEMAELSKDIL